MDNEQRVNDWLGKADRVLADRYQRWISGSSTDELDLVRAIHEHVRALQEHGEKQAE